MAIELQKLLANCAEYCEKHDKQFAWGESASEEGDPDGHMIVIADWNDSAHIKLQDMLTSKFSYEELTCGFDDEYTTCSVCGKYVYFGRYGTMPRHITTDTETICQGCALADVESTLAILYKTHINSPQEAFLSWFAPALEADGWECYSPDTKSCATYETGWHEGQVASPHKVLDSLRAEFPDHNVVFIIKHVEQFTTTWLAYTREANSNG